MSEKQKDNEPLSKGENKKTESLFESPKSERAISCRYFIHDLFICVKECIFGKSPKKETEYNFLMQVESLLNQEDGSKYVETCERILKMHRTHENTKARQRLEKWAKWVIAVYLSVVMFIVFLNGFEFRESDLLYKFKLDDVVLSALLTTTTLNVLGLVIIVLRGHFLQEKDDK